MIVGGRRDRVVSCGLAVHGVMVVLAVAGGLRVMALRALRDAGRCGLCQLQAGALTPSCRARDKRKRDGPDQGMAKEAFHGPMLV